MKSGATVIAALIALVLAGSSALADRVAISVDVAQLDTETYELIDAVNLEKKVVVRLVQEGFAVVAASEDPYVRVRYLASDTELRIAVSAGAQHRGRAVSLADVSDLDVLHLEIAQKTVELIRQMPKPPAPEPEPKDTPVSTRRAPRASSPVTASSGLALDVMAGAVFRGDLDPQLGAGVSHRLASKFAVTGSLGFVPASSPDIDVFEWQAQVGLSWVPVRTEAWLFSAGASVGALVHHFSRQGESGTRADLLVTAPVTLRRSLSRQLGAAVRIVPGFSDESREHTQAGEQLWQRSSARLELLGQLSWEL